MSNEVSKPGDSGEINLNEVESSGRPFLKNGVYSIRCISCEKQTSKKQNPMLVFKWEICAPETITVTKDDGTEQSKKIAGLQLTDWIVLGDTGWSKLKALHKVAGLPMSINAKNPNVKQYVGKALKSSLSTEPSTLKDENTGEPIMDEETGNPVTVNNYRIKRFNGADLEHTIEADAAAF